MTNSASAPNTNSTVPVTANTPRLDPPPVLGNSVGTGVPVDPPVDDEPVPVGVGVTPVPDPDPPVGVGVAPPPVVLEFTVIEARSLLLHTIIFVALISFFTIFDVSLAFKSQ